MTGSNLGSGRRTSGAAPRYSPGSGSGRTRNEDCRSPNSGNQAQKTQESIKTLDIAQTYPPDQSDFGHF